MPGKQLNATISALEKAVSQNDLTNQEKDLVKKAGVPHICSADYALKTKKEYLAQQKKTQEDRLTIDINKVIFSLTEDGPEAFDRETQNAFMKPFLLIN